MRLTFFAAFFITASCSFSQQFKAYFLPNTFGIHAPLSYGADPDLPAFRLAKTGTRWNNTIGGTIPLSLVNHGRYFHHLFASGFVNLYDFDTESSYSVQMIRSSAAINARFQLASFAIGRKWSNIVFLQTGFAYESNFVTDHTPYFSRITYPMGMGNDSSKKYTRRSFRYLEIKPTVSFTFKRKWTQTLSVRYRKFGKATAEQENFLTHSWAVDYSVQRFLFREFYFYTAVFAESISNRFVSNPAIHRIPHHMENFRQLNIEAGIRYKMADKRQFDLFISRNDGAGRGMDFLLNYRKQWGLGLKFIL